MCTCCITEARISDDAALNPKQDSADATRVKHLTDSAEPTAACDAKLSRPVRRAAPHERRLSAEPSEQKVIADTPSPSRAGRRTEKAEPKATNCTTDVLFPVRANARSESVDPIVTCCRIDIEPPDVDILPLDSSEIPDPTRTK
jgi:hypothetical protein